MINLTKYYIKKRLPLLIIITSLTIVSTIVFLATSRFVTAFDNNHQKYISQSGMGFTTVIMLLLVLFFPIYEFMFKMKRNSCDLFYSLPVKRNKLYLFKYLFGMAEVAIIFTINFLIVSTFMIIYFSNYQGLYFKGTNLELVFHPGYYYLYYIVVLITGLLVYSWIAFFFTRANSAIDGIIIAFMSSIALFVVDIAIDVYIHTFNSFGYNEVFSHFTYFPQVALFRIAYVFDGLLTWGNGYESLTALIIMGVISITWVVLFILLAKKERAEDTGDICDNIFGYKTLLPIFIVFTFMICDLSSLSWVAVAIGGYIGYVIYNRHFNLRKTDWIVYLSSVGIGFILMALKLISII